MKALLISFLAYMRQPTSIAGVSVLTGTFTAWLSGEMTAQHALALTVPAVMAIILPDNSAKTPASVMPPSVGFIQSVKMLMILGAFGALSACSATSAAVSSAANDSTSALDFGVQALTSADKAATLYAALPLCSATQGAPCSDATMVGKIKLDAAAARLALQNAQKGIGPVGQALTLLATVNADLAGI